MDPTSESRGGQVDELQVSSNNLHKVLTAAWYK